MSEKWEVNLCTVNMGREFKEYFQIGDFVKIEVYPTTPFDEIEKSAHRIAAMPELEAKYKEAVELLNDTESLIMDDILGLDDFSECDPVLFKETVKHMLNKHIEKILVVLAKAEDK